jgi:hypothetical protein
MYDSESRRFQLVKVQGKEAHEGGQIPTHRVRATTPPAHTTHTHTYVRTYILNDSTYGHRSPCRWRVTYISLCYAGQFRQTVVQGQGGRLYVFGGETSFPYMYHNSVAELTLHADLGSGGSQMLRGGGGVPPRPPPPPPPRPASARQRAAAAPPGAAPHASGLAVSHSCACIGSLCLRNCVHGASIGGGAGAGGGGVDAGAQGRVRPPHPPQVQGGGVAELRACVRACVPKWADSPEVRKTRINESW